MAKKLSKSENQKKKIIAEKASTVINAEMEAEYRARLKKLGIRIIVLLVIVALLIVAYIWLGKTA